MEQERYYEFDAERDPEVGLLDDRLRLAVEGPFTLARTSFQAIYPEMGEDLRVIAIGTLLFWESRNDRPTTVIPIHSAPEESGGSAAVVDEHETNQSKASRGRILKKNFVQPRVLAELRLAKPVAIGESTLPADAVREKAWRILTIDRLLEEMAANMDKMPRPLAAFRRTITDAAPRIEECIRERLRQEDELWRLWSKSSPPPDHARFVQ